MALTPIPFFALGILVKHDLDFNTHLNSTFIAFDIWVIPFIDFSFDGWCGSNAHTSKFDTICMLYCVQSTCVKTILMLSLELPLCIKT